MALFYVLLSDSSSGGHPIVCISPTELSSALGDLKSPYNHSSVPREMSRVVRYLDLGFNDRLLKIPLTDLVRLKSTFIPTLGSNVVRVLFSLRTPTNSQVLVFWEERKAIQTRPHEVSHEFYNPKKIESETRWDKDDLNLTDASKKGFGKVFV